MASAPGEKKARISLVTAFFLMALALIIDGLQFLVNLTVLLIPLSWFLTFFAGATFFIWFTLLDVKYLGRNAILKMTASIGTLVAELVPVINAFPATSLGVLVMIVTSRLEDASLSINPASAARVARGAATGGAGGAALAAVRERRRMQLVAMNDNQPHATNDNRSRTQNSSRSSSEAV